MRLEILVSVVVLLSSLAACGDSAGERSADDGLTPGWDVPATERDQPAEGASADVDDQLEPHPTEAPTAVARARVARSDESWSDELQVAPLTTVELDGRTSAVHELHDGDLSYRWYVIEQPAGATAHVDNPGAPSTQIFIPISGDYQVGLEVTDSEDRRSREMAIVKIAADWGEGGIVVEMIWSTPGDEDAFDTGAGRGSDMDLHFLHPNGQWNAQPWDCYWSNHEPNWGTSAAVDNPSLDIDDTDGWGPETIRLLEPEGTLEYPVTYGVGVFYFSDHGFGPSDVAVRIFINGELRAVDFFEGLKQREFWDVARIVWPPGTIERTDVLHPSGFP